MLRPRTNPISSVLSKEPFPVATMYHGTINHYIPSTTALTSPFAFGDHI